MKKIFPKIIPGKQSLFFFFLVYCISAHAQHKNAEPLTLTDPAMDGYLQKKHPAILTVKIIHAPDTITKVPVKCSFVRFGPALQAPKFYQFDKNGFLKIAVNDRLPYQQIWLNIEHYLYAGLIINDGLNVTIDAREIKTADGFYFIDDGVEYSGVDGELTTVMNKHILYKQDLKNELVSRFHELARTRKQFGDDVFLSKFDSVYQALRAINDEFIVTYPKFKWAIHNQLMAEYLGDLTTAYWFDKMPDSLFTKINSFSPYFSSNEGVLFYQYFFNYIIYKKDNPAFSIDDQLYLNYSNYSSEQKVTLDSLKYYTRLPEAENKDALNRFYKKRQELLLGEMVKINTDHLLHLIDSFYAPPKSDILKTFLLDKGKIEFATTYPEIIKTMQTKWCRNIASMELKQATLKQKQIDSLLAKGTRIKENNLFIGKPLGSLTFNANLYRLDSVKNLDEFIIHLKSKFPNKALVIDFWATWCAPCLKELPVSKKLQEDNKDLPIVFIYICTNSSSNVTVWKNKIAGLQIPGEHIFADDKLVSELQSKFNTERGFPTYVVIDATGKLKPKAIEWIHLLDRDKLKLAVGL